MANGATHVLAAPTAARVYPPAARLVHWLMALAVFILIPVGITITNIGDGALKNNLYEIHKSVGMIAFVLVLVRIAMRLSGMMPPPDESLSRFHRVASAIVHGGIYVILLVMPILGYVATNMCCKPVQFFWTVAVPLDFADNEPVRNVLFGIHKTLGILLLALVTIHIAAALYHRFVLKDGVLQRMLPR